MPIPIIKTKNRKLKIEFKAAPGEAVKVKNYRRKDIWEEGTCIGTTVKIKQYTELTETIGDHYRVSYDVLLDRKSNAGNNLFLTVGNAGIELYPA